MVLFRRVSESRVLRVTWTNDDFLVLFNWYFPYHHELVLLYFRPRFLSDERSAPKGLEPNNEEDAEFLLRTYYTATIALQSAHLPAELIIYICHLADYISPWPDTRASCVVRHKPSKFQRSVFRTSEARKIVTWFRTPAFTSAVISAAHHIDFRALSGAPYPASKALASVFYNSSYGAGSRQRRVPWRNFSIRLVSPTNPKQAKTRSVAWEDGEPLVWPCFGQERGAGRNLPPEAEPQPEDPGVVRLDREHEVWEWAEPGDWLEVTVRLHYSWELASFRLDGALWVFRLWEPSMAMLALIQRRIK